MILRSPTDENASKRFLASARNDYVCHLERSERSFSTPIFEGGRKRAGSPELKISIFYLGDLRMLRGEICPGWHAAAKTTALRLVETAEFST